MELQCEQMSRELAQHRQHSEQERQALQKRLNEARDEGRAEAQKQKEELAHTVNLFFCSSKSKCRLRKMRFSKSTFSRGKWWKHEHFLIGWMHQVAKLSRDVAELEGQLDRAQRDKSSLSTQLEETLCKLSSQDLDRNKVVYQAYIQTSIIHIF